MKYYQLSFIIMAISIFSNAEFSEQKKNFFFPPNQDVSRNSYDIIPLTQASIFYLLSGNRVVFDNENNEYDETPAISPWWKTPVVKVLLAILLILSVLGFYKIRKIRLKLQKDEKDQVYEL